MVISTNFKIYDKVFAFVSLNSVDNENGNVSEGESIADNKSDINDFYHENVETGNYCHDFEQEEQEDVF